MAKKRARAGKGIGKRRPAARPTARPAAGRGPEVVLDLECDSGRAHLVLVNTGDAVAVDVRVEFSRPLEGLGGEVRVSDLALFKGLGVLRPGREFRVFWDSTPRLFEKGRVGAFEAAVVWRDLGGRAYGARYRHDLAVFRELPESLPAFRGMPGRG